jgi:hypothetical protein
MEEVKGDIIPDMVYERPLSLNGSLMVYNILS